MRVQFENKPLGFTILDARKGTAALQSIFYTFIAIKEAYESNSTEAKDIIKTHISSILYNGCPAFDNGHNWGYPIFCACITLINKKEELWNLFTEKEQAQMHECMRMFALMWNFGCNEYNDFRTGMGLKGDYRKQNVGVNYLLSNNALIVFLEQYFGSIEALNELFATVDYETEMHTLKELSMSNAYHVWTTPGIVSADGTQCPGAKELFSSETPITAYIYKKVGDNKVIVPAGEGLGCKVPFAYRAMAKKEKLYTPMDIFNNIMTKHCFKKICKSIVPIVFEDNFSAHIADETVSPYEGQKGMIAEFDAGTEARQRSSIFHSEIDFMICMCYFETMRLLNICEPTDLLYWDLVNVGMEDFIYKREHGYVGYAMYHIEQLGKWDLDSGLAIQLWKEEYRKDNIAEA